MKIGHGLTELLPQVGYDVFLFWNTVYTYRTKISKASRRIDISMLRVNKYFEALFRNVGTFTKYNKK